ncbi:dual specificity phosphatase 12 [Dispira parvispora]|uniref:Dual specificity phosphatase 12 n=1 Tax=Dispira parvispora TaxID=1520584 RepID=A0A9W8E9S6_9FUNG|nr:dual specificity phosphatase 12 [Dispira parvispora]
MEQANCILPQLYLGSFTAAQDLNYLHRENITHIVSVLETHSDWYSMHCTYLWVNLDDGQQENIVRFFPATYDFIDNAISNGGNVLVHCYQGRSRSPTIVIAYLMRRLKLGWKKAGELVRKKRPIVYPNIGFQEQLFNFQQSLFRNLSQVDKDESHPLANPASGTMVKLIPQIWENGEEVDIFQKFQRFSIPLSLFNFENWTLNTADNFVECRGCNLGLFPASFIQNLDVDIPHSSFIPVDAHRNAPPPGYPSPVPENNMFPSHDACPYYVVDMAKAKVDIPSCTKKGPIHCENCKRSIGCYTVKNYTGACGKPICSAFMFYKSDVILKPRVA